MLLKKKATNKCDVVLDVRNAITLTVKNNSVTIFEEKTLNNKNFYPYYQTACPHLAGNCLAFRAQMSVPNLIKSVVTNITSQQIKIEGLRF